MENLIVTGLIFDLIGVFVLALTTLFGVRHQKYPQEKWTKRYGWIGWSPLFKVYPPFEKSRWVIKPKYTRLRHGCIHPVFQWNVVGFICIIGGFALQILGNLR